MIITALTLAMIAPGADPAIEALARCLSIAESMPRLTCLDASGRALIDEITKHDITIVRLEEAQRSRRRMFGIDVPPSDELIGQTGERLDALETTVASATRSSNDHWTLRLAEGGRWETTEAWLVGRDPKPGSAATIRRGSLGAYVLKVGNERVVRVNRIN